MSIVPQLRKSVTDQEIKLNRLTDLLCGLQTLLPSHIPVTPEAVFPVAPPTYLPRSPELSSDGTSSLGPSLLPPHSLMPMRPPGFICDFASSFSANLTSSQSLLIRLRRKITSPALKFSSSLLLPVKSNRAWGEEPRKE